MAKIFQTTSARRSPIGDAIVNLGQNLWGDKLGDQIRREQASKLLRENQELEGLMDTVRTAGGVHGVTDQGLMQAQGIGAGYDPKDLAQYGLLGAGMTGGDTQPFELAVRNYKDTTAGFNATMAEDQRQFGLSLAETRRNNDLMENGRNSRDAAQLAQDDNHFQQTHAENVRSNQAGEAQERYEFQNELVEALDANGNPVFVTRENAPGQQPVLSHSDQSGVLLNNLVANDELTPAQQADIVGVNEGTLKNYILPDGTVLVTRNGTTDTRGNPLPPGGYIGEVTGDADGVGLGQSATDKLVNAVDNGNKALSALDNLEGLIDTHPDLVGAGGQIAKFANAAPQVLAAFGFTSLPELTRQIAADASDDFDAQGVISMLADPNIGALEAANVIAAYLYARNLNGPGNLATADLNIGGFGVVGNASSWLASPAEMKSRISAARKHTQQGVNFDERRLGLPVTQWEDAAPPPQATVPTPDANGIVTSPQNGQTYKVGQAYNDNGQIIVYQGLDQNGDHVWKIGE